VIHVLFSSSAAGTLRQVLKARGIADGVVDLIEWLDTGWISSDLDDRIEWFEDRMPWKGNWAWAADCVRKFLDAVDADDDRLIWLAPQSAQEQSGLFWYLDRTRVPPKGMIIVDYPLEGAWRGQPPGSLGELGPKQMAQLLDEAPRFEWDGSRFQIGKWREFMDDGAVLRVVEDGLLKSVRPEHYDDWLLQWCPWDWTKWYRVIGDAMGHADQPIDDLFLRWRLQELIVSGAIKCNDQLPGWDHPTAIEPAKIRRVR